MFKIRTKGVEITQNLIWFEIPTVKNPDKPLRVFPIDRDKYAWVADYALPWVQWCKLSGKEFLFKHRELLVDRKTGKKTEGFAPDFSPRTVEWWVNKYFGADVHDHLLRHSNVTHTLRERQSLSIPLIKRLWGWKTEQPISTYDHIRREEVRAIFEKEQ